MAASSSLPIVVTVSAAVVIVILVVSIAFVLSKKMAATPPPASSLPPPSPLTTTVPVVIPVPIKPPTTPVPMPTPKFTPRKNTSINNTPPSLDLRGIAEEQTDQALVSDLNDLLSELDDRETRTNTNNNRQRNSTEVVETPSLLNNKKNHQMDNTQSFRNNTTVNTTNKKSPQSSINTTESLVQPTNTTPLVNAIVTQDQQNNETNAKQQNKTNANANIPVNVEKQSIVNKNANNGATQTIDEEKRQQWQQEMLRAHNEHRVRYGVPPLKWSDRLQTIAAAWIKSEGVDKQETSILKHSPKRPGPLSEQVGENIAWGWDSRPDRAEEQASADNVVTKGWVGSEEPFYDRNTHTCQSGQVCGHFTQVVWKDTREVGCATAVVADNHQGGAAVHTVCNYAPAGNIWGVKPF